MHYFLSVHLVSLDQNTHPYIFPKKLSIRLSQPEKGRTLWQMASIFGMEVDLGGEAYPSMYITHNSVSIPTQWAVASTHRQLVSNLYPGKMEHSNHDPFS